MPDAFLCGTVLITYQDVPPTPNKNPGCLELSGHLLHVIKYYSEVQYTWGKCDFILIAISAKTSIDSIFVIPAIFVFLLRNTLNNESDM